MEKKMKKRIFTALTALMLSVILLCTYISAFDANDYDYGGGGGGGGFSYSYDGDSSGGGDLTSLVLAIIVVAIMCVYWWIKGKIDERRKKKETAQTPSSLPNRTAEITGLLRQSDPGFDSEALKSCAKKAFTDIQNAKLLHDPEPLREMMYEGLFNTIAANIETDRIECFTDHCENIRFTQSWLTSYVRDGGFEYLGVYLNAEFTAYRTDDTTGAALEGDPDARCKDHYLMRFARSVSVRSVQPNFCPHCGAPFTNTGSGRCEYCGSAVTAASFSEWRLADFTPVRAGTNDDGIRV